MLTVDNLAHNLITYKLLLVFICFLFTSSIGYSEEISLHSLSMRASFSEATVLGKDAPEKFDAYDLSANFDLQWKNDFALGLDISTRMMVSIGRLRGDEKDALVVSFIPELILGSLDGRYTLDFGIGGALLSRHNFGTQDFGAPFQFAITSGIAIQIYNKLSLGYRFMHYSDAGIHGSDTTGADLHMIELIYKFK